MRPLLAVLVLVLAACSPHGVIRTERGADRVRTAFHIATELYGSPATAVVVSNSHFPCSLPTQPDPDAITEAELDYYMAWNREGSVVLAFLLFTWDVSARAGEYPVSEAASPYGLDEVEPRAALAAYRAVWESEVSEDDGLYREYEPVIEEEVIPVESPGTVDVQVEEDTLIGRFELSSLDVSGRFVTQACAEGSADVLDYLDLFTSSPPDTTEDSGIRYEGAR